MSKVSTNSIQLKYILAVQLAETRKHVCTDKTLQTDSISVYYENVQLEYIDNPTSKEWSRKMAY